ncbi:TraB/GumN family protein [Vibrio sp. CAU 1672]|uniref:TraB/GumN family protein n=1 Tax=Vibrio sp. CAU 1672 TaxID=3032594 RepID=UPI0023D9E5DC|nr:TraB/GumN family protein [Vibrio sp. CAU 1672]MDF2154924.1 TraB/GumN family protein [Vibrio sp. CAU 1672]
MFQRLSVILSLVTLFISHSSHAEPQHWLAKKDNKEYMIIGSVHVGDNSMYPLPKAVTQYLSQSKGLIIEADVRNQQNVTYPSTTLQTKDVLGRKERRHLQHIAKDLGLPEAQLLNAPPWAAALTVQLELVNKLGYVAGYGVDMHLIGLADKQGIPVIALESVQFQIDLIAGQPEGGKELLLSSIKEYEGGETLVRCLISSWKSGDSHKLEQASLSDQSSEAFNQTFLYSRNRDWAEKLDSGNLLPKTKGRYTVVVGSLHLVGKDNLIELLEKRGFDVELLGNSRKADCEL